MLAFDALVSVERKNTITATSGLPPLDIVESELEDTKEELYALLEVHSHSLMPLQPAAALGCFRVPPGAPRAGNVAREQ